MTKELERDLGLWSVMAISIGAMVGSGIFILPALALKMAGPAVVVAYLLAGLLVLPAALSKAEMATAMPEAGGTYIYIERGMGPLLGTIAGIGTWFSLSFKGALALVGGIPYLVLLFDLPVTATALSVAVVLVGVNLVGAKQTGRFQIAIVVIMLAAMVWFVFGSAGSVQRASFENFFSGGAGGLLAATGFVFVSYAGVTKIASVAEEVEDPGRVIPLGMLGSLKVNTLLYVLIVAVIVGVAPEGLVGSNTPVADVAAATMPTTGVVAVVAAAILALISTANAGLLSSSRYPFAMSRDSLAPPSLSRVSDRFNTPSNAITLTGLVMLVLIAFVPIDDIAKLASAFKILVFALVNLAVVAFRESHVVAYDPEFESPLYPWVQAFGVVGGLVLLTQMGTVPLAGAVGIILVSLLWYAVYVRRRVDREGAATDVVRRQVGREAVERTREELEGPGYEVLVGLTEDVSRDRERTFVELAASLARPEDGHVTVVRFDEVPDQTPLGHAAGHRTPADVAFEEQTEAVASAFDVPVDAEEVVSHDRRRAIANHATRLGADVLLLQRDAPGLSSGWFTNDVEWIVDHTDADVVLVDDRGLEEIETVGVLTTDPPYDPPKVAIADAIATGADAEIVMEYPLRRDTVEQRDTIQDYQAEVAALCSAPVRANVLLPDDDSLLDGGELDLLVVDTPPSEWAADRPADAVDCPVALVRPRDAARPGTFRRFIERRVL
jgi:amino acid transporter